MSSDILKFDDNRNIKTREGNSIEFKESFNWKSKGKYMKTIASFANNKGGHIVFGVKDRPRELVGLTDNDFEEIDEQEITEILNSYFSPEISFNKYTKIIKSKNVGFLQIHKAINKPIICLKNFENILKESDIYYRYNARTEKIKYSELVKLLDEIKNNERKRWENLLKKIARIGSSATVSKTSEEGRTNLNITDDPNAPKFKVDDTTLSDLYPLTHEKLVNTLKERYTDFVQNQKFNNIKKNLIDNKNLCYIRYLNLNNKNSSCQKFYSENILKEFDKHYTKR